MFCECFYFLYALGTKQNIIIMDEVTQKVYQHLLVVSKIYKCVTFEDVSEQLGIAPELVEKAVTKLISTDKLKGELDQIDRWITFKGNIYVIGFYSFY